MSIAIKKLIFEGGDPNDNGSRPATNAGPSPIPTPTNHNNNQAATPTPNHNNDKRATVAQAARESCNEDEESEIKRNAKQQQQQQEFGAGTHQFIKRDADRIGQAMQRKQQQQEEEMIDPSNRSDSFNILSVVQERASGSNRDLAGAASSSAISGWISGFSSSSPQGDGGVQDLPPPSPPRQSLPGAYPISQPGACTAAPGTPMDRVNDVRFSIFTRGPPSGTPEGTPTMPSSQHDITTIEEGNSALAMSSATSTSTDDNSSSTTSSKDNNNEDLMEAIPVQSEQFASSMMEAEPIDQENLDQKAMDEAKDKKWKRFGYVIVVIACLVLAVSMAIGLTNKNKESLHVMETLSPTVSPTGSPTRPLPPMENLEFLYDELPERTKESLYNKESPQYQAWEWLLDHPNITTYPEWRKTQIFAMATFYYSFDGPKWLPQRTKSRWLNVSLSECSWVMTDEEVLYQLQMSYMILGPEAYGHKDIRPCNKDGRVQAFGVRNLQLPPDANPKIPPEIGLLTSLGMMEVSFSKISAKLSDLLIPELIEMPSHVFVNFHGSGLSGPIPKKISVMTNLRHFMIGGNRLTGTIPSEIAGMTSLEMFILSDMEGPNGNLPSQLGLLTSLTGLLMYTNSFNGQIPSELGLLTSVAEFSLDSSLLTGSIPSELGLMTSLTELSLDEIQHLGGAIPSELGALTRVTSLQIGSNSITGSIPSDLGLLTSIQEIRLNDNALTGFIPSELGMLTDTTALVLGNNLPPKSYSNNFSGTLPDALWKFSQMETFILPNLPNLHGVVPRENMMPNLKLLRLEGSSHLSGAIPEPICFLQDEVASSVDGFPLTGKALDFECSHWLCGCDCECGGVANETNPDVRHA